MCSAFYLSSYYFSCFPPSLSILLLLPTHHYSFSPASLLFPQVWCGVLAAGADNTPLNSSFKSRSDPKYLNSLGQVCCFLFLIILLLLLVVPLLLLLLVVPLLILLRQ